MERPEVRIIEPQQTESKDVQVFDWEAQQLMQKYGIKPDQIQQAPQHPEIKPQLSFEEMCQQQEMELKRQQEIEKQRYLQTKNERGPRVNYITDEDSGFNYRVEVRMEGMPPIKY